MQHNDQKTTAAPSANEPEVLSSIARRKAILKGLGKTAAVAGAASPLASLATTRLHYKKSTDGKNYHCTVSGSMSALVSAKAAGTVHCGGSTPGSYGPYNGTWNGTDCTKTKWPAWPNDGTYAKTVCRDGSYRDPKGTFAGIFGSGSGTAAGYILKNSPTSDEAQWLCALLNAQKHYAAGLWPHSAQQVLGHYNATASVKANALALYKEINKPAPA